MRTTWPMVPLSRFAKPVDRRTVVAPDQRYRTIGVKWWGEGAYERETIEGAQTAAQNLSIVRHNDLIINKIWVRHGSTAVASPDVDGCAASSEFPTFELDQEQVMPRWMHWLSKAPWFWTQCSHLSQGTSGKNRIQPERFLTIAVPLPPLPEQSRLISRIEDLAAKAKSVGEWTQDQGSQLKDLQQSYIDNTIPSRLGDVPYEPFGKYLHRNRSIASLNPSTRYQGIGIKWWGLGSYVHELRQGSEFNAERYTISPGQIAYNEVWAHIGSIAVIGAHGSDLVASRHFHIFDVEWGELIPEFVSWLFRSTWFWNECRSGSFSSTGRGHMRREHLFAVKLPVPAVTVQRKVVSYLSLLQSKVNQAKKLHSDTATEVDALLPSILDKAFRGEL